MRAEMLRFKEIVDRAKIGHLLECDICGKLITQPLASYFEGMTYEQRLQNGDELLRHLLESAGFDLEKESNITILTYLAHERGGHSSYTALRIIEVFASKEDQDWMDAYGERVRERFERISEGLDFSLDKFIHKPEESKDGS